jgi:hypothetical protein
VRSIIRNHTKHLFVGWQIDLYYFNRGVEMKKVIFLGILIVLLIRGCSKVSYSSEFKGIPIYPGTELIMSNEFDNQISETYIGKYVNGDIEKVKRFFEKNIDEGIWTMEVIKQRLIGHNIDKMYGYKLKSKDQDVTFTIAYSNSDKTGEFIYVSIVGNKLK